MELIKEIGAIAGIGAFVGLSVLTMLYFSQARDVRRLREWAGRAPEREAEEVEVTSDLAAQRAEELRKVEEERAAATTAEQAAAENREVRRQRREAGLPEQTRWERIRDRFRRSPGPSRVPEPRYLAVVIGAVIVLGVGIAVAATQLLGGDDGNGSNAAAKGAALKPQQITVAVLNGTNPPVSGVAGRFSDKLESMKFKTGKVGNSSNSFTVSEVMFKRGHKPEAQVVARRLRIEKVRLMTPDVVNDIAGEKVAVVVGQDMAGSG